MPARPAKRKPIVFRQICEQIPAFMVPKIARKHGVRTRAITPWNHVVAMLYAQFTHALGLNDVCDALAANRAALASIRGSQPPSRNGLSNANRTRNPAMAEDLFWSVYAYLKTVRGGFGGGSFRRLPRRFRRTIHVLHRCSDWAHSFTRLFTCLRSVLWQRRDLLDYLMLYGTAGGSFRILWAPQQAFLPGLTPSTIGVMGQHRAK